MNVDKSLTLPNGSTIYYAYISGKKELRPIVFLHGWGGSSASFTKLIELYVSLCNNEHGDIYVIDFPGFGQSPQPPVPWGIEDYAQCVAQYTEALSVPPAHIVCHSFGGRITAILLTQYPERFVSATCIAPAGIHHRNLNTRIATHVGAHLDTLQRNYPIVTRILSPMRACARVLLRAHDYGSVTGVMRETFKKVIASDIKTRLSSIHQPVQLFFGRNDTYVPVADATIWNNAIPGSVLTIFEDGRHGLHYTHTQRIATDMYSFLQSL